MIEKNVDTRKFQKIMIFGKAAHLKNLGGARKFQKMMTQVQLQVQLQVQVQVHLEVQGQV